MPSDELARVDWSRRTEPEDLPEWMDAPCTHDDLRACLHDLGQVNGLTQGYLPTLRFLEGIIAKHGSGTMLRILDVGFGGGDTLHQIERWSKARGIHVSLTGIDLNPHAALIARERYGDATIRWLSGDVFAHEMEADVVISSLLTHHLSSADVVRFIEWMDQTAAVGWFVNDLERSKRSALLFAILATLMRWHRFVRHDGPVSFARSFTRADWERFLTEAGITSANAVIAQSFPSRLCVSRLK